MHPDYPWLYVGKTDRDLRRRLFEHEYNDNDNIERKYLSLLKESVVYYIEVSNKAETKILETYLINKYKPILNKQDKYENICESLLLTMPNWKRFIRNFNENDCVENNAEVRELKNAADRIKQEIQNLKNNIQEYRKDVDLLTTELIYYQHIQNCDYTFKFSLEDIKIILNNTNIDVEFHSELYDRSSKLISAIYIKRTNMKLDLIVNGKNMGTEIENNCGFICMSTHHSFIPNNPEIYIIYVKLLLQQKQKLDLVKGEILFSDFNNFDYAVLEDEKRDYNIVIKRGVIVDLYCFDTGEHFSSDDIKNGKCTQHMKIIRGIKYFHKEFNDTVYNKLCDKIFFINKQFAKGDDLYDKR